MMYDQATLSKPLSDSQLAMIETLDFYHRSGLVRRLVGNIRALKQQLAEAQHHSPLLLPSSTNSEASPVSSSTNSPV